MDNISGNPRIRSGLCIMTVGDVGILSVDLCGDEYIVDYIHLKAVILPLAGNSLQKGTFSFPCVTFMAPKNKYFPPIS